MLNTDTSSIKHNFASMLLSWFEQHGRHHLPWQYHHQDTADIYAVWLSEIMLQQTQVATVIDYFNRFMARFPTVDALAAAEWDEVAALWAGLGYYARARNLHKGARQLVDFMATYGTFPQTVAEWQTISGVGQSTAGAIVAMGVRGRGVICDGNVKRVLTRVFGIDQDINKSATTKTLWQLADTLTPNEQSGKFAQAMMDLGATVCTRSRPQCQHCPLQHHCTAHQQGNPTAYPVKSKPKNKETRHSLVLMFSIADQTLWLKRHNRGQQGIWEGLWCLPITTLESAPTNPIYPQHLNPDCMHDTFVDTQIVCWLQEKLSSQPLQPIHSIKHTLTHLHWHLTLVKITLNDEEQVELNQLLKSVHMTFRWGAGTELGKPKAMQKLLNG